MHWYDQAGCTTRSSERSAAESAVFSWLGQIAVVRWGLAYWAVARSYRHVPYLLLVYFIEKMVSSAIWLLWLLQSGH